MTSVRDGGQSLPSNAECGNIFSWTWEGFYEGREQRRADVFDIDMAQLFAWTGADASKMTSIFYVTFTGAGGNDPSGDGYYPVVRLRNGALLGNSITVATDYPFYIQGDYNVVNWKPSAMVGDGFASASLVCSSFVVGSQQRQRSNHRLQKSAHIMCSVIRFHGASDLAQVPTCWFIVTP